MSQQDQRTIDSIYLLDLSFRSRLVFRLSRQISKNRNEVLHYVSWYDRATVDRNDLELNRPILELLTRLDFTDNGIKFIIIIKYYYFIINLNYIIINFYYKFKYYYFTIIKFNSNRSSFKYNQQIRENRNWRKIRNYSILIYLISKIDI